MTDLRTAALRALKALKVAQDHWNTYHGLSSGTIDEAAAALKAALNQPEDKSQAAFEHWVETVEATQGCAISRNAVADATCKQSLQVEPIIKPEIKVHNVEPPPEAQTEAEKIAYCAGWWAAMQKMREEEPVAWRTFDGEGGYDYRTYYDNENYRDEWNRRNPNHKGWVEPLYTHSHRQWNGLTGEERDYFRACGFVGVKAVEEKLRARNSTLACHQGEEGK